MDQNGHCVEAFIIFIYSLQVREILKRVYGRQAGAINDSLRWGNVSLEKVTTRNIVVCVRVFSSDVYILDGLVMVHMWNIFRNVTTCSWNVLSVDEQRNVEIRSVGIYREQSVCR